MERTDSEATHDARQQDAGTDAVRLGAKPPSSSRSKRMLVIKRKIGQRIILEVQPSETVQRIEVTLFDSNHRSAKIGVDAGEAVRIRREDAEGKEVA